MAVAGLLLLVAAPSGARGRIDPPSPFLESVRPIECPITVPDEVQVGCGELTVPENHDQPGTRQLRLPYIILRSSNSEPRPDPLVFTTGGPGYSSLDSVWLFADSRVLDDRDVIIFEQRGNRYAEPALMCDASVWWEETSGHTPCLDRIRASGIDITQYSTDSIVRDVVALRRALGYEQWNLYGSSFSTSVMLLVMEADPSGTRSAILQSVKPPNETTFAHEADVPLRAIEQMFTACAADDRCAASYPNLARDFFALVRQLNEEPVELEIDTSADDGPLSIALDGHRFVDWVAVNQLYDPIFPHHDPAYLPLLIDEAHRGNVRPLEIAAQSFWTSSIEHPNWAWGLMFSINCQQDLPAAGSRRPDADLAATERLDGFARSRSQRAICDAWDLDPLAPAATEYVRSDVPALVLAGSFDPVTPPAWSRMTAEHLPYSTYVEFPGRGHNVSGDNPCAAMLEAHFLADPSKELDTSCVETARGPTFVSRDDLYRAPGLARSGEEVSLGSAGGVAWIETITFGSVYGTFLVMLILLVVGAVWLGRIRHGTARTADRTALIAYTLAWLAALASVAVGVLTDQVNSDYAGLSKLAFSLGPSRDFASARLLAWISPIAGVVILTLAATVAWAWLRGRWSIGFRVLTTMSALCSLAVVMLGVRWDLFTMLL